MEFGNILMIRCYLGKITASNAVPLQSQSEFKDRKQVNSCLLKIIKHAISDLPVLPP